MLENKPKLKWYTIEQIASDWGWSTDEVRHMIYQEKSLRIALVSKLVFERYRPPVQLHLVKIDLTTNEESIITEIGQLPEFLYIDLDGKGGGNFDRITNESGHLVPIPRNRRTTVFHDFKGARFSLHGRRNLSPPVSAEEELKPIMLLTGEFTDCALFPGEETPDHVVSQDERSRFEANVDLTQLKTASSHPLAEFRLMEDLKFRELTLKLDTDNFMVTCEGRGLKIKVKLDVLGLMAKNAVKSNAEGKLFFKLTEHYIPIPKSGVTSRLARKLKDAFETTDTPIKKDGAVFTLRITKDDRAKQQAQHTQTSYDRDSGGNDFLYKEDPEHRDDNYIDDDYQ